MTPSARTDAELVGDTLAGKREAFAEIVRRYQALVCSLAYSATGDFARSEDLAQDSFLAVWRQLPTLREPGKLRAWLCGIARHRIQDSVRAQYRDPTHRAETMEVMDAVPAPEDPPSEEAMSKDEADIVWRALAQLPESYREPLILYHRENQSVEQVAALLDLTEDVVRQRLVRGRKLLQAEVASVVEGALRRTAPGQAFNASVMAALPAGGAVGSGIGGVMTAILNTPLAPPLTMAGALLWGRRRMLKDEAASASLDERDLLASHRRTGLRLLVASAVIIAIWGPWLKRLEHPVWYAALIPLVTILPLFIGVGARIAATQRGLARIWARRGETSVKRSWEYCSPWQPLGLPFVHIRLGFDPKWSMADRPVRAWIAIGQVARGRLFALGFVAIAPVSLGGFAIGFVSVGCFALGAVAVGAMLGVGGYAVGLAALGWMASGFTALGLHAAYGFAAYAGSFAMCPSGLKWWAAYAPHANDEAAREFFAADGFFARTSPLFHDPRTAIPLFLAASPWVLWEVVSEIIKGRRREPAPKRVDR